MSRFIKSLWSGAATSEEKTEEIPTNISPKTIEEDDTVLNDVTDEQILSRLETHFFEEDFEPQNHIFDGLRKKKTDIDISELHLELIERKRGLDVINSKLSKEVMSNYHAFVQGMIQIRQLTTDLKQSAIMCSNGRQNVSRAQEELTMSGLVVLSKCRKRQIYETIVQTLLSIKKIEVYLNEHEIALSEGNFPKAIELYRLCKELVDKQNSYSCVSGLAQRLQDSYDLIQEKLDNSLQEICRSFNSVSYERILLAYQLLGKSFEVLEKLRRYFTQTMESHTTNVLYSHILLSDDNRSNPELFKKMKFKDLTSKLHSNHYISCLLTILEYLSDLMYSYFLMKQWHEEQTEKNSNDKERYQYFEEINKGLDRFKKNIWDDIQRRVSFILASKVLPGFKIDEFLKVLDYVNKFIVIGEQFSDSHAFKLNGSIKQQSNEYFKNFHKQRKEDLRALLENELWHRCPVNEKFSVSEIKEFKSFISSPKMNSKRKKNEKNSNSNSEDLKDNKDSNNSKSKSKSKKIQTTNNTEISFFSNHQGNPFAIIYKQQQQIKEKGGKKQNNDVFEIKNDSQDDDDDDDDDDELKQEFINEDEDEDSSNNNKSNSKNSGLKKFDIESRNKNKNNQKSKNGSKNQNSEFNGPLLAPTTINLLKHIGKYLHMMRILTPIGFEVFTGITQIFEYYMYTVYSFFGTDGYLSILEDQNCSQKLKETMNRIIDEIESPKTSIKPPTLSSQVDLTSLNLLFGLNHRIVAMESLIFVSQSLNTVKPLIQNLIPRSRHETSLKFFSNVVDIVGDLKQHFFRNISHKLMNFDQFLQMVANVKWDVKEISMSNSPYVEFIKNEFIHLESRLNIVEKQGCLPESIKTSIYEYNIERMFEYLVEGYSRSRKCTSEGRTLMTLDLTVLGNELSNVTNIRPLPGQSLADNYIKAYYLDEVAAIPWIKEHQSHFTKKQLQQVVLVGVGATMKKKQLKELQNIIDEIDNPKKEFADRGNLNSLNISQLSVPSVPLNMNLPSFNVKKQVSKNRF